MTAVDWIILLVILLYTLNGFHRGFIGTIFNLFGSLAALIAALDAFLPYVDNWATCDQMNPKALGRNKEALLAKIREWLASGRCYTVRYAIGQLMHWYLDADFKPEYADMVAAVRSEEYYVRMMAAWYFATALAKRYEETLPLFEEKRLVKPWRLFSS